jgi:hypothetical protein
MDGQSDTPHSQAPYSEARWRAAVAWMNSTFEFFLKSQEAMGRTRAEALALLKRSWEIEDRERLEGYAELGRVAARAR